MDFTEARSNMVLNQLRANRISNNDLIDLYESLEREIFFPADLKHLSYSDGILNFDDGRFILPPLTSATLIQSLGDMKGKNILEVGSGIGLSSFIISNISNKLDCVESSSILEPILKKNLHLNLFKANFLDLSINEVFESDAISFNNYSMIIINGSLDENPTNILNKISPGTILVCVIDNKELRHKIVKFIKTKNSCTRFVLDEAVSDFIYNYNKIEKFIF